MFYRENSQLSTAPIICLKNKILGFFGAALELLFPQKCLSCQAEGFSFCPRCRGKIPLETSPLGNDTIAVWQYNHPSLQKAIWRLKYRGKRELARDLAESLNDRLLEELAEDNLFSNPGGNDAECYLIIPIPIHKNRLKQRGYNQSELLAKELTLQNPAILSLKSNSLIKTKETRSQVSVENREKRLKNVLGTFTVQNPENIRGKRVIVVDDITTTGATFAEARKALRRAGAKSVLCVALAH